MSDRESLRISTNKERTQRVGNVFATDEEKALAKRDLQRKQASHPFFMAGAALIVADLAARAELSGDFFEYEWRPAILLAQGLDEAHGWGLYEVAQWKSVASQEWNIARPIAVDAIKAVAKRLAEVKP